MSQLSSGDKHLLRLIRKDRNPATGWAKCSDVVWPLMFSLPHELVMKDAEKKLIKLTATGEIVLDWT